MYRNLFHEHFKRYGHIITPIVFYYSSMFWFHWRCNVGVRGAAMICWWFEFQCYLIIIILDMHLIADMFFNKHIKKWMKKYNQRSLTTTWRRDDHIDVKRYEPRIQCMPKKMHVHNRHNEQLFLVVLLQIDLPMSFRVTSLGQSHYCPSTCQVVLKNTDYESHEYT